MSILITLLTIVEVIVCLLLILIVLMQRPRQEGLGAAFGGDMTSQMFGAQTTNVLQKFTVYLAVALFLLTAVLAVLVSKKQAGDTKKLFSAPPAAEAPATPAAAAPGTPEAPPATASIPAPPAPPAIVEAKAPAPAPEPSPPSDSGFGTTSLVDDDAWGTDEEPPPSLQPVELESVRRGPPPVPPPRKAPATLEPGEKGPQAGEKP